MAEHLPATRFPVTNRRVVTSLRRGGYTERTDFPAFEHPMSDETALLHAIAAHPDEDTPRLALADWLDEHGRADRAAFIRGQIELAQLADDSPRRREVAFRCRQLLDAHEDDWLDPFAFEAFEFDWGWSRGFVETFTTSPDDLELFDAELFRTYPFRRVWVCDLNDGRVDDLNLIPANNRIAALDLIGNGLGTNHLKKLAKMTHFPHLRELGFMFNELRDTAVKVLCGEPFFQRLQLLRLGANPFTARGRDQLRAHFGHRITFAHDRDPERLYTIQDDYLRVGWGNDFTQLLILAGENTQRVAIFDHAGNLLRTEGREVTHTPGDGHTKRDAAREAVRDQWLAELGYKSATIKVKRFQFADGVGITPFNWWAESYDTQPRWQRPDLEGSVARWLQAGQYRFNFGGDDAWFDRTGEVTDT